ncbi:MAG: hypothetical protein C0605_12395 [Hyphomicrobiales bacterium]|nr:MAG: hypothetical protein C0605_12395 [Hyphomicrobiales bacterium]
MTMAEAIILALTALLGHAMALLWYLALRQNWPICRRRIYELPVKPKQLRRELINSVHTPMHALFLFGCLTMGWFSDRSPGGFAASLLITFVWAEIWHYASHRAMHFRALHWIHAEHHKSHLNTPFTAISFSFTEKLVFDAGLLGALVLLDRVFALNFYGVASWFIGYLIINSFSHANFEFRPVGYNKGPGRLLASTTYHALHHSRYVGNYGLGTRVLDRLFGTEWTDYEEVYARITERRQPLTGLRQKLGGEEG